MDIKSLWGEVVDFAQKAQVFGVTMARIAFSNLITLESKLELV